MIQYDHNMIITGMACWQLVIIIRMQQQIQVERNQPLQGQNIRHAAQVPEEPGDFQIINDAEEIIQEDITENYEQDFDSISDGSRRDREADNEIKEDFEEVCDDLAEGECADERRMSSHAKQRSSLTQSEQAQCQILENECKQMKEEINRLQQEMLKQQLTQQQDETLQELLKAFESNKETLSNQQAQQIEFFQNKVGKDSFSIPLLQNGLDFEEKLLEEIEKLKLIISMSNIDVSKLKRECKKNEEMLPLQQENKEQFYTKYKKLKRQLQDKKQKYEMQDQKQQDLQTKLTKLKEKYTEIETSLSQLPGVDKKKHEELSLKHQDLVKRREVEIKKNTLAMHQLQNTCQLIARNVLDLRKTNQQSQEKITFLEQKNNMLEEESNKLMQKYDTQKEKYKLKSKEKDIERNESFHMSPHEPKPIPQLSLNRKKYHSQTKNSFITNIFDNTAPIDLQIDNVSHERYTGKPLKNDKILQAANDNEGIIKNALGQSSTSNTLRQFKLKLPSHTPQKSNKNLNISLDINKSTPTKPKGRTDQSKLSITQRLERIELLEREDRIYSHKLNEIKKQESERNTNHTVRVQPRPSLNPPKDISSAFDLPSQQKELFRDFKALISSKTESSMALQSKIMRAPAFVETPLQTQTSPSQLNVQQSEGQKQQNIYSSRLTDRLTSKFFKKRIIYRQKKISEDYMRILEQKGRKILELDNQSEA